MSDKNIGLEISLKRVEAMRAASSERLERHINERFCATAILRASKETPPTLSNLYQEVLAIYTLSSISPLSNAMIYHIQSRTGWDRPRARKVWRSFFAHLVAGAHTYR